MGIVSANTYLVVDTRLNCLKSVKDDQKQLNKMLFIAKFLLSSCINHILFFKDGIVPVHVLILQTCTVKSFLFVCLFCFGGASHVFVFSRRADI